MIQNKCNYYTIIHTEEGVEDYCSRLELVLIDCGKCPPEKTVKVSEEVERYHRIIESL